MESKEKNIEAKKSSQSEGIKQKKPLFRRIINFFIISFAFIVFLMLILFGFSQTNTFREYLKEEITSAFYDSFNGELKIGSIEGTLLTSFILKDVCLTVDNDTLFSSERIELRVILTQLIFKNILIRRIELTNSKIRIIEIERDRWNLTALLKEDKETREETAADTTEGGGFPFTVQLNKLKINNLDLTKQSFDFKGSAGNYDYINFDDLRINDLNLSLKAAVDLKNNNFKILLEKLDFNTNINAYNLQNLSGAFEVNRDFAEIKDLEVKTDRSDLTISARLDSLDLFGDIDLVNFKNYPTRLTLSARPFDFNDLSDFLTDLTFIEGRPGLELSAGGTFGDLNIEDLDLKFEDTRINAKGNLRNLHTPERLFLDILIQNSEAKYKNTMALLPGLELPDLKDIAISEMQIKYRGEPTKFDSEISGRIGQGKIYAKTFLDLQQSQLVYDASFDLTNIDLKPIIDQESRVNASGRIDGRGVDPKIMNSRLSLTLNDSKLNEFSSDRLRIEAVADSSDVELDLAGDLNKALVELTGNIDYSDDLHTSYDLEGNLKNLDIAEFTLNPVDNSQLNFNFTAEGQNFNLEDIAGNFNLVMDSSSFKDRTIKEAVMSLNLGKTDSLRFINLESDFFDLNVNGNFNLNDAIDLLLYEESTIKKIVINKFSDISPFPGEKEKEEIYSDYERNKELIDKNIGFDFDFEFKDFEIFSIILEDEYLNIVGKGNGFMKNDSSNFNLKTDLNLDQFTTSRNGSLYYLSGIEATVNFSRDNRSLSFEKLFGSASIAGTRFYTGINITDFNSDLIFTQSRIFMNASGMIDDLSVGTDGYISISHDSLGIIISNLDLNYKNLDWENVREINLSLNSDSLNVEDFNIGIDGNELTLNGTYYSDGNLDFVLRTYDFPGQIVSYYLLESGTSFDTQIDLVGKITGSFRDPKIRLSSDIRDITYNNTEFGSMFATFVYSDQVLKSEINFIDKTMNMANPLLTINGSIPLKLGEPQSVGSAASEEVALKLVSNNFNLSVFGNALPIISGQTGFLIADAEMTGTIDRLNLSGDITIQDGAFRARANNLDYSINTRLSLRGDRIAIDELVIQNLGLKRNAGTITAAGEIIFDGLKPAEINISADGKLKLLTQGSKSASPSIYGDLLISTGGALNYNYKEDKSKIDGTIYLEETNLILSSAQATYQSSYSDINYIIIEDTTKIEKEELEFERILAKAVASEKEQSSSEDKSLFDYELNIITKEEAKILFLLSPQVNQKLTVFVFGDLQYTYIGGSTLVQGAFNLREGSKLDFFKVFDATGSIRFETSLTDPYLDITAQYIGDYTPPNQSGATEQVAVKIYLQGPLSSLGQNLASKPENISVYYGARNIQNNVPDGRYDAADALSFVLLGKFKSDLTSSDRNQVASETSTIGNTATSFLGPVLTSFVNSAVGDVINDIQLSRTGEYTKFSVSGKYQKFRYSFGGTTQVFQNLYQANIRLEYLFTQKLLMRIERKDPIVQTTGLEDKINEIGIKYRFNF